MRGIKGTDGHALRRLGADLSSETRADGFAGTNRRSRQRRKGGVAGAPRPIRSKVGSTQEGEGSGALGNSRQTPFDVLDHCRATVPGGEAKDTTTWWI